MGFKEINKWLNKHTWTFAKTMKEIPHEYIVKDKLSDEDKEIFVKVVIFIRENGYKQTFKGYEYTYYEIDGHKYWTMGDKIEKTIILNRAKL